MNHLERLVKQAAESYPSEFAATLCRMCWHTKSEAARDELAIAAAAVARSTMPDMSHWSGWSRHMVALSALYHLGVPAEAAKVLLALESSQ